MYCIFFYSFTSSGPGICESGWNQVRGGTAHPLLPKAGIFGPSLRKDDQRVVLLKVSNERRHMQLLAKHIHTPQILPTIATNFNVFC